MARWKYEKPLAQGHMLAMGCRAYPCTQSIVHVQTRYLPLTLQEQAALGPHPGPWMERDPRAPCCISGITEYAWHSADTWHILVTVWTLRECSLLCVVEEQNNSTNTADPSCSSLYVFLYIWPLLPVETFTRMFWFVLLFPIWKHFEENVKWNKFACCLWPYLLYFPGLFGLQIWVMPVLVALLRCLVEAWRCTWLFSSWPVSP